MAIEKINPFISSLQGTQNGSYQVQPISQPKRELTGQQAIAEPSFQAAVSTFSQKANPLSQEGLTLAGAQTNYQNGLSSLATGALGEDAVYVKGGRLGAEYNSIA